MHRHSNQIAPLHLSVPDEQLGDLRGRLVRVRWPEEEIDPSHGPSLSQMRELARYWRDEYDWRVAESLLNSFGQSVTTIDGLKVHFLHMRSGEPDALPLLLNHGWPSSVLAFRHVVGPLTDPAAYGGDPRQAFHVVIPSLPGFGFSGKPTEAGWGFARIAQAWATLMSRLGYQRWVAQGGDVGAGVVELMAAQSVDGLVAVHMNSAMFEPTREETENATATEQAMLERSTDFQQNRSGYFLMQAQSPQTIGYSLADSPIGLAAWIYAVVADSVGTRGDVAASLTVDELLDEVMMYWLPNTATSAARFYREMVTGPPAPATPDTPIRMSAAFSMFAHEPHRRSRRWIERRWSNVVHIGELSVGGHFAALEQPDLFTQEMRASFAGLR
ncbi:epoxide hydrolase family protein [uncultured Mycobacterium sp.]|uniref:epoxide hydrolase family protein n=1 Tax=uncultured Mycobacterium sp. TaxID=171292 RepID=UPI0035CC1F6C